MLENVIVLLHSLNIFGFYAVKPRRIYKTKRVIRLQILHTSITIFRHSVTVDTGVFCNVILHFVDIISWVLSSNWKWLFTHWKVETGNAQKLPDERKTKKNHSKNHELNCEQMLGMKLSNPPCCYFLYLK